MKGFKYIILTMLLTFVIMGCENSDESPGGLVTIQQYNKLDNSMEFEEVIDILGPPHMINFEENTKDDVEFKDENTFYRWDGVAPSSSISLRFRDEGLYTKHQIGLD